MDHEEKEHKPKFIDAVIVISLLLVGLSLLAVFAGSFMHLLGLQYDTPKSFILYFIIASLVAYLLNIGFALIYGLVLTATGLKDKLNRTLWLGSLIFLDALSSIIGFSVVDYFMPSISANFLSILVISIFFSLFDKKKAK